MPLDFPSSPTNGQVYDNFIYSSAKGTWKSLSAGASPSIITNAVISATASNATTVPLTVNGAVSQSANLQEWKDGSGLIKAKINKSGVTMVRNLESYNTASDVRTFFVGDDLAGQVGIGRTDGVAAEPYIDFHSGATVVDYDSRIIASGGNGTVGGGLLSLYGKIKMPSQPTFFAWHPESGTYFTSAVTNPVFANTLINIGNNYSTSTGRFTAPIAGVYEFNAMLLVRSSSVAAELTFRKNNVNVVSRNLAYSNPVGSGGHDPVHYSMYIELAANDYVVPWISVNGGSGTDIYFGGGLGWFSGRLVG